MQNLSRNQKSTDNSQTTSLVGLLDRTMSATFGPIWTGLPKTPEQVMERLSIWSHLFTSKNLSSEQIRKTISEIPATFSKPPSPREFLDLYKSQPAMTIDKTPSVMVTPGNFKCAVSSCTATGAFTSSTVGSANWYCWNHSQHNTSSKPVKRPEYAIEGLFNAQLEIEAEEMEEIGVCEYREQAWDRLLELKRTITERV